MPLESLLPIQSAGVLFKPEYIIVNGGYTEKPIIVLPYDTSAATPSYLLLDGHHRAYNAYQRYQKNILSAIVESDEDVRSLHLPYLIGSLSMADVVERYHTLWLPLIKKAGITAINTMPLKPGSRQGIVSSLVPHRE